MSRELFVLHDMGDQHGGAQWRNAAQDTWTGTVTVPDLPGHGATPSPPGGVFVLIDPLVTVAQMFVNQPGSSSPDSSDRVVLGVGDSGWSAQLLAIAGRCAGLVLVDGLGGPFRSIEASAALRRSRMQEQLRANLTGEDRPATPERMDSRLAFSPDSHNSLGVAEQAADIIDIPTLVVETDQSATASADALALAQRLTNPHSRLESVGQRDPASIVELVRDWAAVL